MSANDCIVVQVTIAGKYVAQHSDMDSGNPDPADATRTYDDLDSLVFDHLLAANLTEYGFQFRFDPATVSLLRGAVWDYEPIQDPTISAVRYIGTNQAELIDFLSEMQLRVDTATGTLQAFTGGSWKNVPVGNYFCKRSDGSQFMMTAEVFALNYKPVE